MGIKIHQLLPEIHFSNLTGSLGPSRIPTWMELFLQSHQEKAMFMQEWGNNCWKNEGENEVRWNPTFQAAPRQTRSSSSPSSRKLGCDSHIPEGGCAPDSQMFGSKLPWCVFTLWNLDYSLVILNYSLIQAILWSLRPWEIWQHQAGFKVKQGWGWILS